MKNPSPEPASSEPRDSVLIKGHKYDGIREYDNPMPGWWVWLFWGTAAFGVVYILGLHVFGFVDSYQDDLSESLDELQMIRHEYAEANPTFEVDEATLASYVDNPSMAEAGEQHFATQCAACHGNQGQGLIGPNLTDDYWIHGGSNVDLFNVITTGVVAQGMPPWEAVYSPEERAELVAYIRSLAGTNPPNAKAPQGDLYTPAATDTTATGNPGEATQ